MKAWQWLLLLGIISVSFSLGAIFGSEVIYIVEDVPTINNGWTDIVQEVSHEDNASVSYQGEQTGYWLVRSPDHAFGRGTQRGRDVGQGRLYR